MAANATRHSAAGVQSPALVGSAQGEGMQRLVCHNSEARNVRRWLAHHAAGVACVQQQQLGHHPEAGRLLTGPELRRCQLRAQDVCEYHLQARRLSGTSSRQVLRQATTLQG